MTPSVSAIIAVALGGAVGCLTRYAVAIVLTPAEGATFPWATLVVNLIGSLLIGVVARYVIGAGAVAEPWRLAIVVGFLGGLTTFSSFAWEIVALLQSGRPSIAGIYWAVSNLAGISFAFLGWTLAKQF
jgi:CrcB protein